MFSLLLHPLVDNRRGLLSLDPETLPTVVYVQSYLDAAVGHVLQFLEAVVQVYTSVHFIDVENVPQNLTEVLEVLPSLPPSAEHLVPILINQVDSLSQILVV